MPDDYELDVDEFSVEVTQVGATTRVTIIGELDLATGPLLVEAVEQHRRGLPSVPPPAFVVDLSRLQFIDAAGVGALIRSTSPCTGRVSLVDVPAAPRRVFAVAGLAETFDIE